ncbi:hypothetical protein ASD45_15005 [Pseudolabrys sp. Root1462]|nr:hypothetical protein ASD45_15005 [Pseudolabrys sp. Root1462]
MSENSSQRLISAKDHFELLHTEIRHIKHQIGRISADPTDRSQDEPVLTLLESILRAIRDQQSSQEVLHQRIDAIARYVPAAARAVSGKS